MTTSTDRLRLFDTWAYHYDTAPGSRAEQAAYDALTLADVDRRGRSQTTNLHGATPTSTPLPVSQSLRGATLPVGPRQRFRLGLRLLQLSAALRHHQVTFVIFVLLIAAYVLAFATFPGPASSGLTRAVFGLSCTAIPLLFGVLLARLTHTTEVQP